MRGVEIVFFDVETTGFSKEDEIIQISACTSNSSFNVYITPNRPVHCKASEVTGLSLHNGDLYLHDELVDSTNAEDAFEAFIDYLKEFNSDVFLVAHNCFGFDMPRILNLAEELGLLDEFGDVVSGFSDSLVILKSALKDKRGGKGSFTLESLVRDYLPNESTDDLHNAECDVQLLQLLLFNSELYTSEEEIVQSSKSIEQYFDDKESKMQVVAAKESLDYYSNILPAWVLNKMAKNKIDADCLKETYQENGFEGVRKLFSQNYYGRVRVTRNRYIIQNICDSLENDLCDSNSYSDSDSDSDY